MAVLRVEGGESVTPSRLQPHIFPSSLRGFEQRTFVRVSLRAASLTFRQPSVIYAVFSIHGFRDPARGVRDAPSGDPF